MQCVLESTRPSSAVPRAVPVSHVLLLGLETQHRVQPGGLEGGGGYCYDSCSRNGDSSDNDSCDGVSCDSDSCDSDICNS